MDTTRELFLFHFLTQMNREFARTVFNISNLPMTKTTGENQTFRKFTGIKPVRCWRAHFSRDNYLFHRHGNIWIMLPMVFGSRVLYRKKMLEPVYNVWRVGIVMMLTMLMS